MTIGLEVRIEGAQETRKALERLAAESPARARAAMNRTVGVARSRVIKTVSRLTGVPQSVLGGRRGSARRGVKGRGYIKLVRATRRRTTAALVGLVEGVRFSRLKRRSLGRSERKPGGLGQPFRAEMRSGHSSLFERKAPQTKISRDRSKAERKTVNTQRKNLPIREVVIPIWRQATRAIKVHMMRAARSVLPRKIWEEIQKSIKPAR